MLRAFTRALVLLAATPAMACLQPASISHDSELAMIDKALAANTAAPDKIAEARKLRTASEKLYQAKKYDHAMDKRHAALIALGFKSANGPVAVAALLKGMPTPGYVTCGSGGQWTAP